MLITLTDEASKKLIDKTTDNSNIKIGVKGSGCNGFSYDFNYLTGEPNPETSFELSYDNFTLWVDYAAVEFLDGMTLDYQYTGINEGFTFINPNAKAYCGCGESFTI